MKARLYGYIDSLSKEILEMADYIHDNPECDDNLFLASEALTSFLRKDGFTIETGVGGEKTSFRAIYENGTGGPSIGLLCEYDALSIGHGCGHHIQGPVILAAASSLRNIYKEKPFRLVVYGTPAEETTGGKITMLENGCFRDIDVALMVHSCSGTSTETKAIASTSVDVTFHGREAHAALCPEQGRSALDALLLTFQGVEFMREHVREDSRMHYTVTNAGGEANVVPKVASGNFCLRSYNTNYLDQDIMKRFYNIVKGAALMTGTTYETSEYGHYQSQIPIFCLNDDIMKNAEEVGAERLTTPREKTGSTDFGNVSQVVPSACLRIACVPCTVAAHSVQYVAEGKTDFTHMQTIKAAKILAATAYDMIVDEKLPADIRAEFERARVSL
jgi:aminobenzoyl-glutamate utilization protein B